MFALGRQPNTDTLHAAAHELTPAVERACRTALPSTHSPMKAWIGATLAILALSACGSASSPTAPSAPPIAPPAPAPITITGRVTATNGGQALAGLSAELGPSTVATDGAGAFTTQLPPTPTLRLALTGSAIVPRTLTVAATASRELAVTAIAVGGAFDLGFYRQFVRDANESATLQPLRRWTAAPNLFLQTSALADPPTLDMIERVAREIVPVWTNGAFGLAAVERGEGTRENQPGWLTVRWSAETAQCGLSDVAKSGGVITLFPNRPTCPCGGYKIAPALVRHEFGHALGFYHTDATSDVMNTRGLQCDQQPSARERYHAAIAYQRPVGNVDPDTDPIGTVTLAPLRAIP